MKKYKYNFFIVILTIILFPIIYFKSKNVFKRYKKFCWEFEKEGIGSSSQVEMNSFEYYQWNMNTMPVAKPSIKKEQFIEYDINSEKGNISCLKVLNKNSKKWVIGMHGWTEDKYLGVRLVEHFYQNGYNIITFDSFAHGKTYGEKTDIGYSTVPIIDNIIEDLKKNNEVENIGLIGNSMGASTAVLYSQIGKYNEDISWSIEDCGFTSLKILYRYYLQNNFTKSKWWLVTWNFCKKFSKEAGVNYKKYNLLKNMQKAQNIPILFLHASGDTWIPSWMSEQMYREKIKYEENIISELWIHQGSEHVRMLCDIHDVYVQNTLEFAKRQENRVKSK